MGKKLKNSQQPLDSNLNLKQGKSKQIKIEKKNLIEVKSTLKNILYSKKYKIETTTQENNEDKKNSYSDYIAETFNSRIIHMLIKYLNQNKEKLKLYEYDKEPNFINKFINLIKELCLNELELVYLTLLLDKFDWKFYCINNHWIYFYALGIYTKKKVTSEHASNYFLESKPKEVQEKYIKLVNDEKFENFEREGIKIQEINQRFKELTKPINTFCRKNFVNYNSISDKIIKMSQPYGEESYANQLIKEKILEENKNNINEINEENENNIDEILEENKLLKNNSQSGISFPGSFYRRKNIIAPNDPKFMSIYAVKNIFDNNNINGNLDSSKIGGTDLGFFK